MDPVTVVFLVWITIVIAATAFSTPEQRRRADEKMKRKTGGWL